MFDSTNRRAFLGATAAGAIAGLGDMSFLSKLPRVQAAESTLDPKVVRLDPEIEPLVRLLEDTSREKLLEAVADKIKKGTTYREVLAALLLAGVRNVQPRPVGFKFHSVLVVNSAHLASVSSPDEHRWLPIFWAIDYFKEAQAQDVRENNWTMAPVDESKVPSPSKARQAFTDAMDRWDESAADAAVAGLVRSLGSHEVFEILCRYGARDFRDIGHKAIFVANGWRTLQCIGWHHAEPVVRSLAYALLQHDKGNPSKEDLPEDRPGRENVSRAAKIRTDWIQGQIDDKATKELLVALRTTTPAETCEMVVEMLNRRVSPQSVFDALAVGGGELLMRQPGIVALHATTTSNALRYAFETSANDETRRWLLLQNAAFVPMFRDAMQRRGKVESVQIDSLEPTKIEGADDKAVADIFAETSRNRLAAAKKVLAYAHEHPDPTEFINAARVFIFLKGTNSHDYKFSSAVLEDYRHLTPGWRERYLAASVFNLRGSEGPDNKLVARTRAALS